MSEEQVRIIRLFPHPKEEDSVNLRSGHKIYIFFRYLSRYLKESGPVGKPAKTWRVSVESARQVSTSAWGSIFQVG